MNDHPKLLQIVSSSVEKVVVMVAILVAMMTCLLVRGYLNCYLAGKFVDLPVALF